MQSPTPAPRIAPRPPAWWKPGARRRSTRGGRNPARRPDKQPNLMGLDVCPGPLSVTSSPDDARTEETPHKTQGHAPRKHIVLDRVGVSRWAQPRSGARSAGLPVLLGAPSAINAPLRSRGCAVEGGRAQNTRTFTQRSQVCSAFVRVIAPGPVPETPPGQPQPTLKGNEHK